MADSKLVTLLKVAVPVLLLVVIVATGLAVAITVGVTKAKLGQCLFTTDITCTDRVWLLLNKHSSVPCNYCLTIQIFAISVSPVLGIYWIVVNLSSRFKKFIFHFIVLGVEVLITVLILATAGVITAGLNTFCDLLFTACPGQPPYKTCKMFENLDWSTTKDMDGSSFYSMTESGKGAAWVSFLCWTLLTIWSGAIAFLEMASQRRGKTPSGPSAPTAVAI